MNLLVNIITGSIPKKMQEDDIKMASYWMQVDPCSDSMNGMDDEKTPKHTA